MSLTARQKARVNKVLTRVPAAAPSEREEDPPDEEREGERDVWRGVMFTFLLYRVRLTSGTLRDRCISGDIRSTRWDRPRCSPLPFPFLPPFFIHGFSQSVCDESASTLWYESMCGSFFHYSVAKESENLKIGPVFF